MIQIWIEYFPYKRDFLILNKSVINYLPRCTYHLLYSNPAGLQSSFYPAILFCFYRIKSGLGLGSGQRVAAILRF